MEGPSTSAPTLESSESQIRRLKEANKSIIDIKRYVDEIKSTLPTRIQEKQEELSLQLPQMLLPKEKQVNSLLAKLPPQVSTAKILEKAGQLKTVLQLLHLHNQSGKLIREATILNSGAIEVAQRPFLVRRHAYAAILMKADTQTQLSSLFTDCATTAGGDIGYFSVDGRIYEKLFNDQICCSDPITRAYVHYDQEKITDIGLLERALIKFRDCSEVTTCHFNRLSNDLQRKRYFVLKKLLILLSSFNEKKRQIDIDGDLKVGDYSHFQLREMHKKADSYLRKQNLDEIFPLLKNVVWLAENICIIGRINHGQTTPCIPLVDMITLQSYLQSGLGLLYTTDICSKYEGLYQKGFKQLKAILNSTTNPKLKKNGLDSLIAGMPLPATLSYKDAVLREGMLDTNGFLSIESWRALYESDSIGLYQIILKLNKNRSINIKRLLKATASTAATKQVADSETLLEKLAQEEKNRKERAKQGLSKKARRREQRKKNKEKIDTEFDPSKLEEAVAAHKSSAIVEKESDICPVVQPISSTSTPSASGLKENPSIPTIRYSKTLQGWFNGEFDQASEREKKYHRIGKPADAYVLLHGHQSKEKCPRGITTVYEMPGEMHYAGGRIEQVMFRLIQSTDGIVFHREVKPLGDLSRLREFAKSAYELHYPALGEESNPMLDEIYIEDDCEIKENQFCIYCVPKDKTEPTIILYKPHDA